MGEASQASVPQSAVGKLGRNGWALVQGIVTGFLSIWALLNLYGASDSVAWRWTVILGWPIGLWIIVAVHELGHAVAAWSSGWKVVAIAAGPFGFHIANKDFAFVPRSKRTEFEGFVLPLPRRPEVWTNRRNAIISAGGSAANLLAAAALFAVWWVASEPVFHSSIDWPLVAFGAGLGSLCIGLRSLTPTHEGSGGTDGDHLIGILRLSRADWRRYRAFSYLRTLLEYQTRLRDLPLWIVDEASGAAEQEGGALQQAHQAMLIGIVLDSPPVDLVQARAMLDEFRDRYGPDQWLNSCDAYFTAVWEGDAERARSLQWAGAMCAELRPLLLAAEAAIFAREGNEKIARESLNEMRVANRELSIFPDHTFRDIGRQIEAILRV